MPLDARAAGPQQIGDYDILLKIAEGGMGSVYKARHRITGDIVALKVLPPATAKNPVLLKRFEQEYRTAAVLDHPNIVRAIDFHGAGPNPFLVMEYVEGESLGQKVDREGPMAEDEAIRVIAQVCQGLHKAHKQKLIHRDVKPDNVLLTPDGVAKLTDLGLVKEVDNEMNLTKTGRGLGTPNFMAPEQFRNAKNADIRCDIYSLGATLYTMLTGEAPFGKVGPLDCWMRKVRNELIPPRELNPRISERTDWAIRRAMSGDPDKRPGSCKEFVEDLMGAPLKAPAPAVPERPPADLWYLVYRDEDGETHTVKGTTQSIRQALREGLLGDASNVRAGRTKQGQFLGLMSYPEFRDLVIEPAPLPTQSPSPSGQMLRQTPMVPPTQTPVNPPPRPDPEAVDYVQPPRSERVNYYDPTQDYRPVSEDTTRPLIPVGKSKRRADGEPQGVDWLLWGGVLVVALATSVAAVFLIPKLKF
ncbi:MAG TPA: serine/threonine-protein kinase [Gemmataceae bacterium]|nr:serine/threonine-protein kinase [Gemmataceae bacterium]